MRVTSLSISLRPINHVEQNLVGHEVLTEILDEAQLR